MATLVGAARFQQNHPGTLEIGVYRKAPLLLAKLTCGKYLVESIGARGADKELPSKESFYARILTSMSYASLSEKGLAGLVLAKRSCRALPVVRAHQ